MKVDGPKIATLTGLAVGDALGMPFEMEPANSKLLLGWDGWFKDGETNPFTKGLKPGQWTDDTKMAKALTESLVENGTYCPGDAAKRYLAWYDSNDLRGIGTTTAKALSRLQTGLPWTQSGVSGSEGNGTAMRAAPIGVAFWRNIQAAAEMARIDAAITHKSEMAEQGSVAIAVGVALLIEGRHAKEDFLLKVLEWIPKGTMYSRILTAHHKSKLGAHRKDKNDRSFIEVLAQLGAGGHVIQTVPAAFCAFVGSTSYQDAVELAIRCGGDTDTTAAITGALAGTHYGIEQVARYADTVEAGEELRKLEVALLAAVPPVGRKA